MSSGRNIYLKMKTLNEAREILFTRFPQTGILPGEAVPVPEAVGRVLTEPVTARLSSPNFHSAAMDGIAVKAEHTFSASETKPLTLDVGRDAYYINTGHVLPENANAVIMIEHVNVLDENRVEIEVNVQGFKGSGFSKKATLNPLTATNRVHNQGSV